MVCLICGGKKGINIKKAIENTISSYGDEVVVVETIENMCEYIGCGYEVGKALITEQSFTDELTEQDEDIIRQRIVEAVEFLNNNSSETQTVFLTRYQGIAHMLSEETISMRGNNVILLKAPPYATNFMINIFKDDITELPKEFIYETSKESEETVTEQVETESEDTDWEEDSSSINTEEWETEDSNDWEEDNGDWEKADDWYDEGSVGDTSFEEVDIQDLEKSLEKELEDYVVGSEKQIEDELNTDEELNTEEEWEDSKDEYEESKEVQTNNELKTEDNVEEAGIGAEETFDEWEDTEDDFSSTEEELNNSVEEFNSTEYESGNTYSSEDYSYEDSDRAMSYEDEYEEEENQASSDYGYTYDDNESSENNVEESKLSLEDNITEKKTTKTRLRGRAVKAVKENINSDRIREEIEPFAKRGNSIVVTGPSGAGTSTVVLNMANALAGMGFDVLIVDMDTVNRAQGYMSMDAYRSIGVDDSNMMSAVNSSSNISRHVSIERAGLHLLTMGMGGEVAPVDEILAKEKISRFINLVKGSYNFVIYDMQMKDAMEFLSEITYSADNLVLVADESNWGISKLLLHTCNIQSEDMQDSVFTRAQILFNKARGINRVLGYKINSYYDIPKVMDNKVLELVGESTGLYFSDMHIIGEIPYDLKFENGWFNDKQYTDSKEGKQVFYQVIRNTILRK